MAGRVITGSVRGVGALLSFTKSSRQPWTILCNTYAKKAAVKSKGKGMIKDAVKGPEVCKDPVLLTTHAMGVNIYKQGTDPELKKDTEYPEWLFNLHLGPPKKLEELEPDSFEYWKQLRKHHMWRLNKLRKGKKL
ncbi:large ribosomal subunit protein mL54 [Latimeria chalumnae]|uniref:Large ribosomal subunit protein mL54 n=1 Tax=Latimeria chalumnae TaxID=7897 RepID=H3B1M7_LATCH|nr:PREDICTED: 39S ribosomal protein L54, mitochondrial [Latimeria chalumnae]|eukprot:XP_005999117.1 PREDICTED: 39S ribosomal protein L54, mitochondrial [Latimeria chalumnae]